MVNLKYQIDKKTFKAGIWEPSRRSEFRTA